MIKVCRQKVLVFLMICVLTIGLFGFPSRQAEGANLKEYQVIIENFNKVTTYDKIPERIVTLSIGELEICLALGLKDKIVGIVIGYAEKYDQEILKLPVLADGYGEAGVPSLETIIDASPDFVYGTAFAFHADYGIASQNDFDQLGINTYVSKGTYDDVVTMDDVFEDIINIGKIFNKEADAKELVEEMKTEIRRYEVKNSEPLRVFVYDSGIEKPSTAGKNSLVSALIERVGGKNIFDNLERQFASVNWESIAEANPQIIVINDYKGTTAEEKINILKDHPAMADVAAIKDDRFIIVPLDYILPGMKNIEAIKILSEGMAKEQ